MSSSVFISYRKDDAGSDAVAISNFLRQELGEKSVFIDIMSVQAGAIWPKELQVSVKLSETVLVIIGPDWLRAGSDEWGRRRIDQKDDWVCKEIALALSENKRVIPVLVRNASIPPREALPKPIKALQERQAIEIRRDYWDHDVKLLLAQFWRSINKRDDYNNRIGPYPVDCPYGPDPMGEAILQKILDTELTEWKKVVSPLPENASETRIEIFREYKFKSFQGAIRFMNQVAPGCDIAMHHPRWENIWKTIKVYLSTWDINHRISDRDIQLARYFDRAYADFPWARKISKK
ncbi:MAG: 4a-hydroxytetrahydrobiopterin dehydratase [Blastocatellia bacterium]